MCLCFIAQLSGEMGNNLGKLAHGYGLAWWLQEEYGLMNSTIVLRHQEGHNKWLRARAGLQKCFPNTRSWDFETGNTPEFLSRQTQQAEWLGSKFAEAPPGKDKDEVDQFLQEFLQLLRHENAKPAEGSSSTISLPFLYANSFVMLSTFMDRYYDNYRQLFSFDDTACCKLKPDPDESVFVSETAYVCRYFCACVLHTLTSLTIYDHFFSALSKFSRRDAKTRIQPRI